MFNLPQTSLFMGQFKKNCVCVCVMVFNANYNNISVISQQFYFSELHVLLDVKQMDCSTFIYSLLIMNFLHLELLSWNELFKIEL
jgi:hypothetical protein